MKLFIEVMNVMNMYLKYKIYKYICGWEYKCSCKCKLSTWETNGLQSVPIHNNSTKENLSLEPANFPLINITLIERKNEKLLRFFNHLHGITKRKL